MTVTHAAIVCSSVLLGGNSDVFRTWNLSETLQNPGLSKTVFPRCHPVSSFLHRCTADFVARLSRKYPWPALFSRSRRQCRTGKGRRRSNKDWPSPQSIGGGGDGRTERGRRRAHLLSGGAIGKDRRRPEGDNFCHLSLPPFVDFATVPPPPLLHRRHNATGLPLLRRGGGAQSGDSEGKEAWKQGQEWRQHEVEIPPLFSRPVYCTST